MKIKSQRDFWSGVMFLTIGIAFAIGSRNYSMGVTARPGPGYFPLMLSVILAILGAIVLFKSLTIETEDGEPVGAFAWRPWLVIVASIVMFGLSLPRLGMFITLPIFVVIVSFANDDNTWLGVIANAVILTVFSWLVFVLGLKLTIPLWPTIF